MKLYKVLWPAGLYGRMISFACLPTKWIHEYYANIRTVAKAGRIFCFDSYEHAYEWASATRCAQIWEVEAEDAVEQHTMCRAWLNPDSLARYWDHRLTLGELRDTPAGTYGCHAITPLRKLYP